MFVWCGYRKMLKDKFLTNVCVWCINPIHTTPLRKLSNLLISWCYCCLSRPNKHDLSQSCQLQKGFRSMWPNSNEMISDIKSGYFHAQHFSLSLLLLYFFVLVVPKSSLPARVILRAGLCLIHLCIVIFCACRCPVSTC